jgi:nicotinamidase-related amidase
MKGKAGWQLAELLEYNSSDFIVAKSSSDAFSNTDLKSHLESLNINHLVICGMQSEFCVDSTIRRALALNYAVTAVSDAHTTLDNEVISAATISMHHNCTWENITSYSVSAKLMTTNNIHFK